MRVMVLATAVIGAGASVRSAARSLAERARGFSAISAASGPTGFLVRIVKVAGRDAACGRCREPARLPAPERCRRGLVRTHQIPRPFTGMTVFENLYVAAANGGRFVCDEAYDRCIDSLQLCGMLPLANRRAETLGLLDRKRLELARALASNPKVLLLDEVAGGLTEQECRDLIALIGEIRRSGMSIVWIEHVVHALLASVDRLVVLHNGTFIADGEPRAVIKRPQVAEIYLGIEADA